MQFITISNSKQKIWFRYAAMKVKDSPECYTIDDYDKSKMLYASSGIWAACFDGQKIRGSIVDNCIIVNIPILVPSALPSIHDFINLNIYQKKAILIGPSLRGQH